MKNLPQSSLTMFPENFAAMMILYNTVPNKSAVLLTFIFYRSIFHLLSQFKWGEIGVWLNKTLIKLEMDGMGSLKSNKEKCIQAAV